VIHICKHSVLFLLCNIVMNCILFNLVSCVIVGDMVLYKFVHKNKINLVVQKS